MKPRTQWYQESGTCVGLLAYLFIYVSEENPKNKQQSWRPNMLIKFDEIWEKGPIKYTGRLFFLIHRIA